MGERELGGTKDRQTDRQGRQGRQERGKGERRGKGRREKGEGTEGEGRAKEKFSYDSKITEAG